MRDFHQLRVYQMAFEAAMEIYVLSKKWPPEERYSLTDQIRRASRSVCANIAEGWRKRRYPASFVSKMSDADTEAGETLVWLEFALRCSHLPASDFEGLSERYNHICAQLVTMINQRDKWCAA
ncbi:MAG: four helix bundle protein [Candidatus Binatia bacterium]